MTVETLRFPDPMHPESEGFLVTGRPQAIQALESLMHNSAALQNALSEASRRVTHLEVALLEEQRHREALERQETESFGLLRTVQTDLLNQGNPGSIAYKITRYLDKHKRDDNALPLRMVS